MNVGQKARLVPYLPNLTADQPWMIDGSSAELSSEIAMGFTDATPPQDTLQAVERERCICPDHDGSGRQVRRRKDHHDLHHLSQDTPHNDQHERQKGRPVSNYIV